MRTRQLKIKIKSLVAETSIIKQEERKIRNTMARIQDKINEGSDMHKDFLPVQVQELESLQCHRRRDVRKESRLASVVYGLLRGRTYRQIENTVREGNELSSIEVFKMAQRFGYRQTHHDLMGWLNLPVPEEVVVQATQAA